MKTVRRLVIPLSLSALIVAATLALPSAIHPAHAAQQLTNVASYSYTPLLDSDPYGRLNVLVDADKLLGDGQSSYDWYFYHVQVQSVPGTIAYGSNWSTADTWAHDAVAYAGTDRWLVDYDPTTTSGVSTVTVSIDANASQGGGSIGFGTSWTYSVSDVVVHDESDYSQNLAYWWHDIDEDQSVGQYTYKSEPGFVEKTTQDSWSYVDGWFKVQFARPNWWGGHDFTTLGPSPTLYLDARRSGDS